MPDESPEALFKRCVQEHGGTILRVARAYTFTAEDCQDLVQDILLQTWRSLGQFQRRSSLSTWLYRVALNTALGWRRKESRRLQRQQPLIEPEALPLDRAEGAEQLAQRETLQRLYAAIRRLPKTDAALVLLYLEDFSYRQMAEVLGISEGNVGVKLNRAKKALSQLMEEPVHEP